MGRSLSINWIVAVIYRSDVLRNAMDKSALFGMIAAGGLLIALASGCSAGVKSSPTQPAATGINSTRVLNQAVAELSRLESASFALEHLRGTTALIPGFLEMQRVSGVVDIPNRFQLKVEAESLVPRSFVEIQIRLIEDQAYMTDPGTGQWGQVAVEALPFNLSNLGRVLADIIASMEGASVVIPEELRGYDTYHVEGSIKSEALLELIPGAGEGFEVGLRLWLDQSRNLLVQALITGRVITSDEVDTVRVLTLDDMNVPMEIAPPQ